MVGIQLKSKVGEKGQVVIPKPIRDQLNLEPETEVLFDIEGGNIVLKKKRSGEEALQEFVSIIRDKKRPPKHIDWDKEYYSQIE